MAIANPPYRFGFFARVPNSAHTDTPGAPDRENPVAFGGTPLQAASVYTLIFVLLVPFIVLGMVMGLFWWEEPLP